MTLLAFCSMIIFAVTSVAYLSYKNANTTKAFKLYELQSKYESIKRKVKNQGTGIAQQKSLQNIFNSKSYNNMVSSNLDDVIYIDVNTALANLDI